MNCVAFLVWVVFLGYADAITTEEESVIKDVCCSYIEQMVASLSTLESCQAQEPPDHEYQPEEEALCRETIASCCKELFKNKESCAAGIQLSSSKQCRAASSELAKNCCEECTSGTLGESQGNENCGSQPDGGDTGLTSFLRKEAFYKCCLASNGGNTNT